MPSVINCTTTNGIAVSGDNSGSLQLATNNGTTAVTIDTSQNVGIGVTPSAWTSGSGVIQNAGGALWQFGSSNVYLGQNYYWNGTNRIYIASAEATEYQQGAGLHRWYTASSGTTGNAVTMSERMRIASDGTISTTIGSTLYGAYPARAWVNFNGTSTVAIRQSRNVSSITDNGTGDYTVNFTQAMPDAEYSVAGAVNEGSTDNALPARVLQLRRSTPTTSSSRIGISNFSNSAFDAEYVFFQVFR